VKKIENIKISSEDMAEIESGAYRQALIELGIYSIPTHKVHKNKKTYNRKSNQNTKWQDSA
jgi:hypothetical protein